MKNNLNCDKCVHYASRGVDPNTLAKSGECRRNPPQVIVIPVSNGVQVSTLYPMIGEGGGICGEYIECGVKDG